MTMNISGKPIEVWIEAIRVVRYVRCRHPFLVPPGVGHFAVWVNARMEVGADLHKLFEEYFGCDWKNSGATLTRTFTVYTIYKEYFDGQSRKAKGRGV
jgi:hypothetical protein